jgi:energy-coupling factor transporter ATP-binding protein EcfA2
MTDARARTADQTFVSSFNARALSAPQVAQSFVPPKAFETLTNSDHTLLVGPRGSGKTTLLKMLQTEALEHWQADTAAYYREKIEFTGVFVPSDNAWHAQLGAAHIAPPEQNEAIAFSAFTTHILHSLFRAIRYRVHPRASESAIPHRRVEFSQQDEQTLVKRIASAWLLDVELTTFSALDYALAARLAELGRLKNHPNPEVVRRHLDDAQFIHLDFVTGASLAIEVFDDLAGSSGDRWAFLFDELENAPHRIRELLITSLRSVNPLFLFKLSLAPYHGDLPIGQPEGPLPGQDFDYINLTYPYKRESEQFARRLFEMDIARRARGRIRPEKLLGSSRFDSTDEVGEGNPLAIAAYEVGSTLHNTFVRLKDSDPTFDAYLEQTGIDLDRLDDLGPAARAANLRKVRNLVVVREYFRQDESRFRSRKSVGQLYAGASSLFAMVEGNPRLLISMIQQLMEQSADLRRRITRAQQGTAILRAIERFLAYLRTVPGRPIDDTSTTSPGSIVDLLDAVGHYLADEIIRQPFRANAPGAFYVDSEVRPLDLFRVAQAVNAGALIHVPDDAQTAPLETLLGKKFRLTYLLAPHYKLPLRLGRAVALSAILKKASRPTAASESAQEPDQVELFPEDW